MIGQQNIETPADAFYDIDEILFWLEDARIDTSVERHPYGDTLTITLTGWNPEARQLDVDRFAGGEFEAEYVLDFGDELEVD